MLKGLAEDRAVRSLALRYTQNWSIPSTENPFPLAESFLVVEQFWFNDVFDVPLFLIAERELLAEHRNAPLMDLDASISFLAHEGVMPGYG